MLYKSMFKPKKTTAKKLAIVSGYSTRKSTHHQTLLKPNLDSKGIDNANTCNKEINKNTIA